MRRAATLGLTALLLAGVPGPILSQTSPPAAKSLNDQVADVRTRIQANETARNQALMQCDLDKLRQLAQEASDLLNESNRLLDAVQADPNSSFSSARGTNGAARLNYNQALLAVTEIEEKCRKQPEPDGGAGVAPVQSPTPTPSVQPTLPPPFGFGELWADAMKAFQAHYSAAPNCDPNGMRSQRAKLEIYARDAEKRFGKIRRNKGFQHEETKSAEAYKKAIEALWQSALTMTPLNCPRPPPRQASLNSSPPSSPSSNSSRKFLSRPNMACASLRPTNRASASSHALTTGGVTRA